MALPCQQHCEWRHSDPIPIGPYLVVGHIHLPIFPVQIERCSSLLGLDSIWVEVEVLEVASVYLSLS